MVRRGRRTLVRRRILVRRNRTALIRQRHRRRCGRVRSRTVRRGVHRSHRHRLSGLLRRSRLPQLVPDRSERRHRRKDRWHQLRDIRRRRLVRRHLTRHQRSLRVQLNRRWYGGDRRRLAGRQCVTALGVPVEAGHDLVPRRPVALGRRQRRSEQWLQPRVQTVQVSLTGVHPVQHRLERALAERPASGGGERHSGRPAPPVGRLRHHLALDELRRQIARRTDHQTGLGETQVVSGLGDAEVDHHRLAVEHHHVARLEVAVDHSGQVDGLQRLRQASSQRQPFPRGQRPAFVHLLVQRPPRHESGDQIGLVGLQVVVEDACHARVAHLLQCGRFALQPGPCDRVVCHVRAQHLERDLLALRSLGQVDDTHPALPEPPDQPVRPDPLLHLLDGCGRRPP